MAGYRIILQDGSSVYIHDTTGYYISENKYLHVQRGEQVLAVFNFEFVVAIVDLAVLIQVVTPHQQPVTVG